MPAQGHGSMDAQLMLFDISKWNQSEQLVVLPAHCHELVEWQLCQVRMVKFCFCIAHHENPASIRREIEGVTSHHLGNVGDNMCIVIYTDHLANGIRDQHNELHVTVYLYQSVRGEGRGR